ncbi:MAG: glycine oxidase ThiO [Gemmatimonadales bacterium]
MPAGVSTTQVAVVGGGVIGAACARAAAQRGLPVTLFAPGPDVAAASAASAGMLAAQIEPHDDQLLPLAVRGRSLYEHLAATLKDTTGINIRFQRTGIASVAFAEHEAAALQDRAAAQRQRGLPCDWLEAAEVHERWPGIAPQALGALFAPEGGCLDPATLTAALLADARRLGAAVVPEGVVRVALTRGRVSGVVTKDATVPAENVVLAAGAWSARIGGLPRPLPIEPVRGQLVATPWPEGLAPVILHHDHAYLLPRGTEAILGSTMERAGYDARTTNQGTADIRAAAERLCPAICPMPTRRVWAGLRPMTPDGRPILGADPDMVGLWYATGHGRNGILLAAITGEILGDLLATGRTDVDISQFSVGRFGSGRLSADG